MVATQEIIWHPIEIRLAPTQQSKETRANWLRWITDPEIRQWMSGVLPQRADEVYRWVHDATDDTRRHYFDILSDGKAVGFMNLRQDQMPETTGEIGIVIGDKPYQSRGIGTQAIHSLLTYAKETVHLTSVRALIKPDNEKSIRLFTKMGFSLKEQVMVNDQPFLRFEKPL